MLDNKPHVMITGNSNAGKILGEIFGLLVARWLKLETIEVWVKERKI